MPWVRSSEWSESGRQMGVYSKWSEQLRVASEEGKVGQGLGADSRKTKTQVSLSPIFVVIFGVLFDFENRIVSIPKWGQDD